MHQHAHHHHHKNEQKARLVVYLTIVVMIGEITVGYLTNSVALRADGWHMAAHVLAIGLTWYAYSFARKHENDHRFLRGTKKIFALSGYTSAIILTVVSMLMLKESVAHLIHEQEVEFGKAIGMACLGLVVNGISAFVLHHEEKHRDHNIHAAYLHVLADAFTSIAAIVALTIGYYTGITWLDSISGILSSLVIGKWAFSLALNSGKDLLDFSKENSSEKHSH